MGVLSPYMTRLTFAQKALYDRLRAQGMDDAVARNIAIAVERNTSPLQKSAGLQLANAAMQKVQAMKKSTDAHRLARQAMAKAELSKSAYLEAFREKAKAALPPPYYDKLHAAARNTAGGRNRGKNCQVAEEGEQAEAEPMEKMAPQPAEFRADTYGAGKKKRKKADDEEKVPFAFKSRIVKAMEQPWQRIVHSVVYAPDTFDLQGDRMDAETIEKAAHEAMRSGIYVNHEHGPDALGAHVVESYIAPCDMNLGGPAGRETMVKKGTWVMGLKVTDDAIWQGVVDGTYCGFSLEGSGIPTVLDLPH